MAWGKRFRFPLTRGATMRTRYLGLTLLEILVVILVIAILIAITVPVVQSARYRAKDTVCLNNMRQILQAIGMYRADYNQELPSRLSSTLVYTKTKEVYKCPVDLSNGISFVQEWERIDGLSYYYFRQATESNFLRLVSVIEPNHGIIACIWHPESNLAFARQRGSDPFFAPYVRRGLIDGSVKTVRKRPPQQNELDPRDLSNPNGNGCFNGWILFTNAPCPPEYCHNPDCLDG